MRIPITVHYDADWTIGTGHAAHGGADQTVARTASGLPYINGRYLRQLLRDSAEEVARGFDNGDEGPWAGLVHRLFGAVGKNARRSDSDPGLVRVPRLHLQWQEFLSGTSDLATLYRRHLTIAQFSTAVDDKRGTSSDDTLRLIEANRRGLIVTGHLDLAPAWDGDKPPWPVALLLQAAARRLVRVAAGRRRGGGTATVTLKGLPPLEQLLDSHESAVLDGSWQLEWATPQPQRSPADIADSGPWRHHFTMTLHLNTPAICAHRVLGNTTESLDHVPAHMLLPLISQALGKNLAPLMRDAHLRVLPAHPVINGHRATRMPQSWESEDKGRGWRRGKPLHDAFSGAPTGSKPPTGWHADGHLATTAMIHTGHAVIDDVEQRPLEDGFFVLEAIAEGTTLQAEIWGDDSVAPLTAQLPHEPTRHSLGRSLAGEFGDVTVTWTSVSPETPHESEQIHECRILLATPAILLNEFGQPDPQVTTLLEQLALPHAVLVDSRIRVTRVETWNAQRGLPRPSVVAIDAGSVLLVRFAEPVSRSRVEETLAAGVGELPVEGYGSLQLLDGELPTLQAGTSRTLPCPANASEPTDPEWQQLASAMWRDEIVIRCRLLAEDPGVRKELIPGNLPPAQIGGLRSAARQCHTDDSLAPLAAWVKRVGDSRSIPSALDELCHAENTDDIRTFISDHSPAPPLPADVGGLSSARLTANLVIECARRQHHAARQGGEDVQA